MGRSDRQKFLSGIKMGIALSITSSLIFFKEPLKDAETYSIWAIVSVVVVFEFSLEATFSKGIYRAIGTLCAGLGLGVVELAIKAGDFEEEVIVICIFKAVDSNGVVKLSDFGVSACMFTGDRKRSRNTFVGWLLKLCCNCMDMTSSELFLYNIWSSGITALELAHGHAPFSKYPPMKVLLMTLQNAPPGLDYERDEIFKVFQGIGSNLLSEGSK